jgi:peptide/nickel transport system substrate-binding protein
MADGSYWQRGLATRLSRRNAIRAAAAGGLGLTTAYALACGGGSNKSNSSSSNGSSSAAPAASANRPAAATGGTVAPGGATAVANTSGETQGKPGGTIVFAGNGNPPNYDLVVQNSYLTSGFISLVYNGLMTFRNGTAQFPDATDNTIVPDLAASAPEQPDNTTYTFKLRQGVKWQKTAPMNGRAFTSADVKWSYDRAVTDPLSTLKADFSVIDKIETPDDTTIKLTLKSPYSPFFTMIIGGFNRYIFPREVGEAGNLKQVLIGTGPYLLDKHEQNVRGVFKKNPDYFKKDAAGQQLPYTDEVDWLIIADSGARLQALQSRQANFSWILSADELDQLKSSNANDFDTLTAPGISGYFYMRLDQPPFNDKRVRQAMSLSIDRPAMIQAIGKGKGTADLPIPYFLGDLALQPDKMGDAGKFYTRDIQAAKQLMAAAGHADGIKTTLSYTAAYGATFVQAFQLMQGYIKEIGIDATAKQIEYAPYLSSVFKGDFDGLAYGPRGIFPDVDPYVGYFYTPGSIYYQDHSDDKDLQAMIAKQRQALDKTARVSVLNDIQKYLSDTQYRVYDVATTRSFAWAKNVKNLRGTEWFPYTFLETGWISK